MGKKIFKNSLRKRSLIYFICYLVAYKFIMRLEFPQKGTIIGMCHFKFLLKISFSKHIFYLGLLEFKIIS